MSVQAGVTVYDVQAIPASYLALTALHQTTLETIRCSGETVGDVLLSFFEEYNKTLQKNVQSKKLDQLDNFELSVEDSMADILKSPIGYDAKSSSSNKIMFSNQEKKKDMKETINTIGVGTIVSGDIDSKGDIRVDGTLKGTVNTLGKVVLGKEGVIEGDVSCNSADIAGVVNAKITVSQLLLLKSTAKLNGDIVTNKLSIEPGAAFTGSCSMGAVIKDIKDAGTKEQKEKSA